MKQIVLISTLLISVFSQAQEVKISEENVEFLDGRHNAIVVSIPYANKDVIEDELKSEMKDWGGKYNNSKGVYTAIQASMKAMGDKKFDGYAKIIGEGENLKVAFAVDLGGAYLSKSNHSEQYKVIEKRVEDFGREAAKECVLKELEAESKILKSLEDDKSDLEKSIERSKNDIEDYKKKIEEAEKSISENESAVSTKTGEISKQAEKITEVEKKLKGIK
ncbi:MAG: hypothetical protein IT221_12715 [Fluviicola sp.]|nr:hypothetical protein [Fluviicola sp.]